MYENLIMVKDGVVSRTPVPTYLYGLTPETLLDLSWTDPQLGLITTRWMPEDIVVQELPTDFKFGEEIFEVDEILQVIHVTREILPMSQQEKDERDAATISYRKYQALNARQEREMQGYTYQGRVLPVDDSARLKLVEIGVLAAADSGFSGFYPSPVDPWFELDQSSALSLSRSAANFLWACLQREHQIVVAIEDWSFTDSMLTEGWPA